MIAMNPLNMIARTVFNMYGDGPLAHNNFLAFATALLAGCQPQCLRPGFRQPAQLDAGLVGHGVSCE